MRIIKLSSKDIDFPNRASVDTYFAVKLPKRTPAGQFLLTKGRIAGGGIETGEAIIFSYATEITHIARAATGRCENGGDDNHTYPFYFVVDMNTLSSAQGNLSDVEARLTALGPCKNIVRTQCWPRILNSPEVDRIWNGLRRPEQAPAD